MAKAKRVTQKKVTSRSSFRKKQPFFKNPMFLVFIVIFAAIGGYFVFKSLAYSPTTENPANGTTPNGYHSVCIDPNNSNEHFVHVNYCSSAEKSDGFQNSSTFIWCADTTGKNTPVENNWVQDGSCPADGGSSSGGSGSGSSSSGGGGTVTVNITASPATVNVDSQYYVTWQVTGTPAYCTKSSDYDSSRFSGNSTLPSGSDRFDGPVDSNITHYTLSCYSHTGVLRGSGTASVINASEGAGTPPTVTFSINPSTGQMPVNVDFVWTSKGATACSANDYGNGTPWNGPVAVNGNKILKIASLASYNPAGGFGLDCWYYNSSGAKVNTHKEVSYYFL